MAFLPVQSLALDHEVQQRVTLDMVVVGEYADEMRRGSIFPPIIVYHDGDSYWVADGFHRAHGAILAGLTEVEVEVRSGTKRDAILFAVGANEKHGLRRTNADKRKGVETLLNDLEWAKWPDAKIADACRVTREYVVRVRASCDRSQDIPKIVERGGTTYIMDTGNIGRRGEMREDDRPSFDMGQAALEMAATVAERGDSPSLEEWEQAPDEYVGHCYKQCYGPRVMVKGDVIEFGHYGVYVCTGCGYAYPPRGEPDKLTDLPSEEDKQEELPFTDRDPRNYHVSDDSYEWYTPPEYIEAARTLMGSIDLDPASCEEANEVVKAGLYYTLAEDGLTQPWMGNVWMNPPYNMPWIERFAERVISEYRSGNIKQAIILTNNATDTAWFHKLMGQGPFCLTKGRIRFWGPGGDVSLGPRQGQAIFYAGPPEMTKRFQELFGGFGAIVVRMTYDNQ